MRFSTIMRTKIYPDVNFKAEWNQEHTRLDRLVHPTDLIELKTKKRLSFEYSGKLSEKRYPPNMFNWYSSKLKLFPQLGDISGTNMQYAKCREVSNTQFMRIVIRDELRIVDIYFLEGGDVNISSCHSARLERKDSEIIQAALNHTTKKAASLRLKTDGYSYSAMQLSNQTTKNQTMLKERTGRKVVSKPADLMRFHSERFSQSELKTYTTPDEKMAVCFTDINKSCMDIYTNCCPTQDQVHDQQQKSIEYSNLRSEQRTLMKDGFFQSYKDGKKFRSRIEVDVTFDLSDGFITPIFGEVGDLFTLTSTKKSVYLLIGWMIHSTKEKYNHTQFADFIRRKMKDGIHRIPSVTVDGEIALKEYSNILGVKQLRCLVHLSGNIKNTFKSRGDRIVQLLKGYQNEDSDWIMGLLDSGSDREMKKKIEILATEGEINEPEKEWLIQNTTNLMDTCSFLAQFGTGSVSVFNSTNVIEQKNRDFKRSISKQKSHESLARFLLEYSNDQVLKIYSSFRSNTGEYQFVDYQKTKNMSNEELLSYTGSLGLSDNQCLLWQWPSSFLAKMNLMKLAQEEVASRNLHVKFGDSRVFTIEEPGEHDSNFVTIAPAGPNKALTCQHCHNYLPTFLCKHIICVLKTIESDENYYELSRLELAAKSFLTEREVAKRIAPNGAGKKHVQRKGSERSHNNGIRTIRRTVENPIFADIDYESDQTIDRSVINIDDSLNLEVPVELEDIREPALDSESVVSQSPQQVANSPETAHHELVVNQLTTMVSDNTLDENLYVLASNKIFTPNEEYTTVINTVVGAFIHGIKMCDTCQVCIIAKSQYCQTCKNGNFSTVSFEVGEQYHRLAEIREKISHLVTTQSSSRSTQKRRASQRLSNENYRRKRIFSPC